ncbi:dihydrolipoamide acetyltransferase family protein [Pontibacillus sp. HMF3514]|uniref:dihydrolipoamide acetyltransferase family protein n=1 Tax=Pontibacillus sp. HMF3514 TaxID=2692425 RepID=UPI00131FD04A|nr:dihydrolipoamide acetyltransferase family protein [Pontibacillus sp. HMF3514]QHE52668.1 2-oxo acid dehydrogenase subunit E2 [Pontibacillus sp. HMF3514]
MVEVKLHDIGEGMTEAEVLHYFVKAGDSVKADDPLVEVQTDKMTAEIPAPANGTIEELKIEEGTTISVGTTVLVMNAEGAVQKQEESKPVEEAAPQAEQVQTSSSAATAVLEKTQGRVLASPYTRKIARDHGIDIESVEGTGPAGRIMDDDVYRFLDGGATQEVESAEEKQEAPSRTFADQQPESIPFKGRRKQIAKKMSHSLHTIAHCTHFEEIDVTDVQEWRKEWKSLDQGVSMTAIFIKAISLTLKDFPMFNAKLDEENEMIHLEKDHHIGIATDTPDGLIVPVIHHVNQKSIKEIHEEMKALTAKAQNNELTSKDMTGGTFTISNVGPMQGSIGATPIINHPEVGLMAFHKTKRRPEVRGDDEIVIRSMMNVSMSFDHRVVDGASAVTFTNRFAQLIEHPNLITLELV